MTESVIEYCKKVSKSLGKGYAECVYQEAICVHLRNDNISYSKESILPIVYKDIYIGNVRSDIILNDPKVVIECKAIDGNLKINHVPQLICYMRIMNINSGILVNFNQHPAKNLIEYIKVNTREQDDKLEANIDNVIYILDWNGVIQE